jgi:hypothetical protein
MMCRILPPFSLIPALLLLSCSGDAHRAQHSFRIFKEDGVSVAETTGGPRFEGELFRYEAVTTLVQDTQQQESLISSIGRMFRDDDGNSYVVDYGTCRIVVFDQEGRYCRSIGREGDGPGEFRWVDVTCFDGEIFQIWDPNLRRLSHVHRDGTFLGSQPPPNNIWVAGLIHLPDKRYLAWSGTPRRREDYAWTSTRMLVLSAIGDTLAAIQSEEVITGMYYSSTNSQGFTTFVQRNIPFTSYPAFVYAPDRGLMLVTGGRAEVLWYDLDGRHISTCRLDFQPRRITPEMKQRYEDNLVRMEQERAERTGAAPRPIREQVYPEFAAIWRGGFIDDAGYAWLRAVLLPGDPWPVSSSVYYVLDREGRYLGQTVVPGLPGTVMKGCLLTVIEDKETGEETPVVMLIRPAARGLKYP